MSNLVLFAVGTVVSMLVFIAMAIVVWAAIQDGRYNTEQQLLAAVEADQQTRRRTAA